MLESVWELLGSLNVDGIPDDRFLTILSYWCSTTQSALFNLLGAKIEIKAPLLVSLIKSAHVAVQLSKRSFTLKIDTLDPLYTILGDEYEIFDLPTGIESYPLISKEDLEQKINFAEIISQTYDLLSSSYRDEIDYALRFAIQHLDFSEQANEICNMFQDDIGSNPKVNYRDIVNITDTKQLQKFLEPQDEGDNALKYLLIRYLYEEIYHTYLPRLFTIDKLYTKLFELFKSQVKEDNEKFPIPQDLDWDTFDLLFSTDLAFASSLYIQISSLAPIFIYVSGEKISLNQSILNNDLNDENVLLFGISKQIEIEDTSEIIPKFADLDPYCLLFYLYSSNADVNSFYKKLFESDLPENWDNVLKQLQNLILIPIPRSLLLQRSFKGDVSSSLMLLKDPECKSELKPDESLTHKLIFHFLTESCIDYPSNCINRILAVELSKMLSQDIQPNPEDLTKYLELCHQYILDYTNGIAKDDEAIKNLIMCGIKPPSIPAIKQIEPPIYESVFFTEPNDEYHSFTYILSLTLSFANVIINDSMFIDFVLNYYVPELIKMQIRELYKNNLPPSTEEVKKERLRKALYYPPHRIETLKWISSELSLELINELAFDSIEKNDCSFFCVLYDLDANFFSYNIEKSIEQTYKIFDFIVTHDLTKHLVQLINEILLSNEHKQTIYSKLAEILFVKPNLFGSFIENVTEKEFSFTSFFNSVLDVTEKKFTSNVLEVIFTMISKLQTYRYIPKRQITPAKRISVSWNDDEDGDNKTDVKYKGNVNPWSHYYGPYMCTYLNTGSEYIRQPWFHCFTCGLTGNKGACLDCALTCHRGHDLVFAKSDSFYCDCYNENSNCLFNIKEGCEAIQKPTCDTETLIKLLLLMKNERSGHKTLFFPVAHHFVPLGNRDTVNTNAPFFISPTNNETSYFSQKAHLESLFSLFNPGSSLAKYFGQVPFNLADYSNNFLVVGEGKIIRSYYYPTNQLVGAFDCSKTLFQLKFSKYDQSLLVASHMSEASLLRIQPTGILSLLAKFEMPDKCSILKSMHFVKDKIGFVWDRAITVYNIGNYDSPSATYVFTDNVVVASAIFIERNNQTYLVALADSGRYSIHILGSTDSNQIVMNKFVSGERFPIDSLMSYSPISDTVFVIAQSSSLLCVSGTEIIEGRDKQYRVRMPDITGNVIFVANMPENPAIHIFQHVLTGSLLSVEFTSKVNRVSSIIKRNTSIFPLHDGNMFALSSFIMNDELMLLSGNGLLQSVKLISSQTVYQVPASFWVESHIQIDDIVITSKSSPGTDCRALLQHSRVLLMNKINPKVITIKSDSDEFVIVGFRIYLGHHREETRPTYLKLFDRKIDVPSMRPYSVPLKPNEVGVDEEINIEFGGVEGHDLVIDAIDVFVIETSKLNIEEIKLDEAAQEDADWFRDGDSLLAFSPKKPKTELECISHQISKCIQSVKVEENQILQLLETIYTNTFLSEACRLAALKIDVDEEKLLLLWSQAMISASESNLVDDSMWEILWRDVNLLPDKLKTQVTNALWSNSPKVSGAYGMLSLFYS